MDGRVAWFPYSMRLDLNRSLGLVDGDYRGVHRPAEVSLNEQFGRAERWILDR